MIEEKYNRWFSDNIDYINDIIYKNCKEYLNNAQDITSTEDIDNLYNYSKLKISVYEAGQIIYVSLYYDPIISIEMNFKCNYFSIIVRDQLSEFKKDSLNFMTEDINIFVKYWNTILIGYFNYKDKLPKIPLFTEER